MEVLKKIENEFLNRTELYLRVPHKDASTPSKESLKSEIAKKFKVEAGEIEIKYIFSQKNRDNSVAKVFLK